MVARNKPINSCLLLLMLVRFPARGPCRQWEEPWSQDAAVATTAVLVTVITIVLGSDFSISGWRAAVQKAPRLPLQHGLFRVNSVFS